MITLLLSACLYCSPAVEAQNVKTDAYIKLNDAHGKHPRVESVTFTGSADNLDMYNSLYGHGAVIENPWLAFRVYMDNRQSIDLYVKQTPRLELEQTGFYTTPAQIEEGYGCDVLWAGQSVAAGSFRGWQNDSPVCIDTVSRRTQSVVSPECVKVIDREWIFNGHPIEMTQTYCVNGDSRELGITIHLEGYSENDLFCTGIQKLEMNNKGFIMPEGKAASWGDNIPDKAMPDLVESVGLAIEVDPTNIVGTREDSLNYLFILKPDSNGDIRYKVSAAGSREKDGVSTAQEWFDYILKQMSQSNH